VLGVFGGGGGHPIQWFICAVIGVNGHRTIGFDQQKSVRRRQVGFQAADIINRATSNN